MTPEEKIEVLSDSGVVDLIMAVRTGYRRLDGARVWNTIASVLVMAAIVECGYRVYAEAWRGRDAELAAVLTWLRSRPGANLYRASDLARALSEKIHRTAD